MVGYTQGHAERQTEGETLLYDIRYRLYDIKGPIITRGKMCALYDWPMVVSQEEDRLPCLAYLQHSYYGTTENTNSR